MGETKLNAEKVIEFFYSKLDDSNFAKFMKGNDREVLKKDLISLKEVVADKKNKNYFHDLIKLCQLVWKELFVSAMSDIDTNYTGFETLTTYFDKFAKFEELLYSTDDFYRDHTTHVLWTYFLVEWILKKLLDVGLKYDFPDYIQGSGIASKYLDDSKNAIKELYNKNFTSSSNQSPYHLLEEIFKKKSVNFEKDLKIDEFHNLIKSDIELLTTKPNWEKILRSYEFLKQSLKLVDLQQAVICVAFLCHDLGYPLKRITIISEMISDMLKNFQAKETTKHVFSIKGGVKGYLNEIINFISGNFVFTRECKLIFKKNQPIYMNLLIDSETFEHGLMSAFLLSQKIQSMLSDSVNINTELDIEDIDICSSISKLRILKAIALHTCERMKISNLRGLDDLLIFVDFIEEFSRMTRASLLGTRIDEFCDTFIDIEQDEKKIINFTLKYKFHEVRPIGLDPELTFKGKAEFIKRHFNFIDFPLKFKLIVIDPKKDINEKNNDKNKENSLKEVKTNICSDSIKKYILIYKNNDIIIKVDGFGSEENNMEKQSELEKFVKKDSPNIIIDQTKNPKNDK